MANTTTGTLSDSLEFIIDSGRIVREFEGVNKRTCDVVHLTENSGLSWDEITLSQLSAQAISETTEMDNPQSYADALLTITPTMSQIQTRVTDRVYRRCSKQTLAKMGVLAMNALARHQDEDYLAMFSGFTTQLSGTGSVLAHTIISDAVSRIRGNTVERAMGDINTVLHGFQIKDLQDELEAGVGTYTIPTGMTADIFRQGMAGIDRVSSSAVWEDGNIAINATPDARGACHAKEAVICVMGFEPKKEVRRRPDIGGGADEVFITDEHAFGERSAGNWAFGILSDATAPA